MIEIRTDLLALLLGTVLLTGCDIFSPGYSPPGEDHEVSGRVLWVDSFREDPGYIDLPGDEDCRTEGLNLHASRLRGTEREIITGGSSIAGYPEPTNDLALDRSARKVYWAAHTRQGPPCGPVKDLLRIEQVDLADGSARPVRRIDHAETDSRYAIPALAVAGANLVWAEVATEGPAETSMILKSPLPTDNGLRPDTVYATEGAVEALEVGPDGKAVYWNTRDDRLFRTRFGGRTTRLSEDFSGEVEAIGGRPARIYWTEGSSLRSVALDGSASRRDGTVPEATTAMTIGPKGERVFVGTEGADEGIWVGPLSGTEASQFDKCVGEGKSGNRHREDFRAPRSLAVFYEGSR